jgi:hypothetical protein
MKFVDPLLAVPRMCCQNVLRFARFVIEGRLVREGRREVNRSAVHYLAGGTSRGCWGGVRVLTEVAQCRCCSLFCPSQWPRSTRCTACCGAHAAADDR